MTDSQVRRMHELEDAVRSARLAVYAAVPGSDTPFAKCRDVAGKVLSGAVDTAERRLRDFETRMIREGRAYRSATTGLLMSN